MTFKIPFTLSQEEKTLYELYTLINNSVNNSNTFWSLKKEESIAPKSAKVSGFIEIWNDGNVRKSDSFTIICDDDKPRDVIISIANIKLLVMCCNSLGLPIDFEFEKAKKESEFKPVKTWKAVAEECNLDPMMVVNSPDLRSLTRYCKLSKFPIAQALEATAQKFESERVTVKQFFEFIWGEENYNKVKSVSKKRQADRIVKEDDNEPIEEQPEEVTTQHIPQGEPRKSDELKRIMGILISKGINSTNFHEKSPSMSDKYGNFMYFCMYSNEKDLSTLIVNE
jgi:hypothetical protein